MERSNFSWTVPRLASPPVELESDRSNPESSDGSQFEPALAFRNASTSASTTYTFGNASE